MSDYYEWIKVLHVISVISWMVGLLYLPRLFVYHAGVGKESESDKLFKLMEYRLLRYIMNPAMIATYIFGLTLSFIYGLEALGPWFHIKMGAIALLSLYHGLLSKWRKNFADGLNKHSANFYRVMNEVPTILMVVAVIMVIVKPFD